MLTLASGSVVPAAASVLRGVVLDHVSGRPLARARVSVTGAGMSAGAPAVLTDSAGRFQIDALPAGAYVLKAEKSGYAAVNFGQRQWGAPGTPISLEQDAAFHAEIRMRRLGAITGQIRDENGLGLPGVAVAAYKGGSRIKVAGAGQSDDRGVYRIAGLEPGQYYVRTLARELEDKQGLLPTFFGQSPKLGEAHRFDLKLDEEIEGVDIQPVFGKLSILAVTLHGAAPATVRLESELGRREASATPGGTVVFDQLEPGTYLLRAEGAIGQQRLSAYAEVAIAGESEATALTLAPSPRVRLRCQERYGKQLDPAGFSVFLRLRDVFDPGSAERFQCGETASLAPGHYEVAALNPPDFYIASISNARIGEDAYEFRLAPGQEMELGLTFSSQPARIEGTVLTPDGAPAIGAPVYLFSPSADLRVRLGGFRTAQTDQEGVFRFSGLPPGNYELVSTFAYQDPAAEWRPGHGKRTSPSEGETAKIELRLGGGD